VGHQSMVLGGKVGVILPHCRPGGFQQGRF
jgi:hypothetical protein